MRAAIPMSEIIARSVKRRGFPKKYWQDYARADLFKEKVVSGSHKKGTWWTSVPIFRQAFKLVFKWYGVLYNPETGERLS